jgi:hypothetical protein
MVFQRKVFHNPSKPSWDYDAIALPFNFKNQLETANRLSKVRLGDESFPEAFALWVTTDVSKVKMSRDNDLV